MEKEWGVITAWFGNVTAEEEKQLNKMVNTASKLSVRSQKSTGPGSRKWGLKVLKDPFCPAFYPSYQEQNDFRTVRTPKLSNFLSANSFMYHFNIVHLIVHFNMHFVFNSVDATLLWQMPWDCFYLLPTPPDFYWSGCYFILCTCFSFVCLECLFCETYQNKFQSKWQWSDEP